MFIIWIRADDIVVFNRNWGFFVCAWVAVVVFGFNR